MRFKRAGAHARTRTATVPASGRAAISTNGLRPGVYRLEMAVGGLRLAPRRLRIAA